MSSARHSEVSAKADRYLSSESEQNKTEGLQSDTVTAGRQLNVRFYRFATAHSKLSKCAGNNISHVILLFIFRGQAEPPGVPLLRWDSWQNREFGQNIDPKERRQFELLQKRVIKEVQAWLEHAKQMRQMASGGSSMLSRLPSTDGPSSPTTGVSASFQGQAGAQPHMNSPTHADVDMAHLHLPDQEIDSM